MRAMQLSENPHIQKRERIREGGPMEVIVMEE